MLPASRWAAPFGCRSSPAAALAPRRRSGECRGPPRDRAAAAERQLQAVDLHKSYRKGPVDVPVLRGLSLSVRRGEFLAVVGQSGSGKSTLLHLLGTLDVPDQGEIHFRAGGSTTSPARPRSPCGTAASA